MDHLAPPDLMRDVYEGDVFRDFMPLLKPNDEYLGLAFQLNLDWFQPFKRTELSVGVLYLACLNLPREVRFLPENLIVVAIFVGEPKIGVPYGEYSRALYC